MCLLYRMPLQRDYTLTWSGGLRCSATQKGMQNGLFEAKWKLIQLDKFPFSHSPPRWRQVIVETECFVWKC